jgi:hypothetical protein
VARRATQGDGAPAVGLKRLDFSQRLGRTDV